MSGKAFKCDPDCYKCKHKRNIQGNTHKRCGHPNVDTLHIKGDPMGIRGGWFSWPGDFDPIWLDACDGFVEIAS